MAWKRIEVPKDSERSEILREFRKKARYLVDETLGEPMASALREQKWNARSVHEVGLRQPRADRAAVELALCGDAPPM